MEHENRNIYWDVVKGLGIIAVVLGHSGCPSSLVILSLNFYHMALFFFIGGFFYKDKYSEEPYGYVGKKLKGLWWPQIKYVIAFILLHNIFLKLNIYSSITDYPMIYATVYYNTLEVLSYCFNALFQTNYPVEMAGAMWFVLPLFVSMVMLCVVRYSAIILNLKTIKKEIYTFIVITILGAIGIIFSMKSLKFAWRVDVALFSMPIVYFGYLCKTQWSKINLKWYFAVLSLVIIYYMYKQGYKISYVEALIGDPIRFYLATLSGIYLNLYVAKFLMNLKYVNNIIACLGKNSFHIMALQFLSFKAVNLIDVLVNNKPIFNIAQYPYSNATWWPLNLLAGLLIPVAGVYFYKLVSNICISNYNKWKVN